MLGNDEVSKLLGVNYNLFLNHLGENIRKKLCFLYQGEEIKWYFTTAQIDFFLDIRTVRCHLIKSQYYLLSGRLVFPQNVKKLLSSFQKCD